MERIRPTAGEDGHHGPQGHVAGATGRPVYDVRRSSASWADERMDVMHLQRVARSKTMGRKPVQEIALGRDRPKASPKIVVSKWFVAFAH